VPPKSRKSTLVAFEAEASRVAAVPDKVAPFDGMSTVVVGAVLFTVIWKVPAATPPLVSSTWQVTVLDKGGKVEPDGGVQAPGVAPGRDGGVGHVTTAPALLVATTVWSDGTRTVPVKLAPVRVAPVRLAL
jgi:hypothetical protein